MLRSVCLKNFVKFKERQCMDFKDGGPFICIGENGSGKSAIQEGIRRCLSKRFNTSVSSSFDPGQLCYFICDFELCSPEKGHVICGMVILPHKPGSKLQDSDAEANNVSSGLRIRDTDENVPAGSLPKSQNNDTCRHIISDTSNRSLQRSQERKSHGKNEEISNNGQIGGSSVEHPGERTEDAGNQKKIQSHYKFVIKYSDDLKNEPIYVDLVELTKTIGGALLGIKVKGFNPIESDISPKQFRDSVINQKSEHQDIDTYLRNVFKDRICENALKEESVCERILKALSKNVVFTFPLRSIGPLQWSESSRINIDKRQGNYTEAESRCEIIKMFP